MNSVLPLAITDEPSPSDLRHFVFVQDESSLGRPLLGFGERIFGLGEDLRLLFFIGKQAVCKFDFEDLREDCDIGCSVLGVNFKKVHFSEKVTSLVQTRHQCLRVTLARECWRAGSAEGEENVNEGAELVEVFGKRVDLIIGDSCDFFW